MRFMLGLVVFVLGLLMSHHTWTSPLPPLRAPTISMVGPSALPSVSPLPPNPSTSASQTLFPSLVSSSPSPKRQYSEPLVVSPKIAASGSLRVRVEVRAFISKQKSFYQHPLIVMLEGLLELGAALDCSANYFPLGGSTFLCPKRDPKAQNGPYDILISGYLTHDSLPMDYQSTEYPPAKIMVNWEMGQRREDYWAARLYPTPWTLYLVGHLDPETGPKCETGVVHPIGFGLTNRLIQTEQRVRDEMPNAERKWAVLFPHIKGHTARDKARQLYKEHLGVKLVERKELDPIMKNPQPTDLDKLWQLHTGQRHNMNFYKVLRTHRFCDATGGYFVGDTIYQWDSFKLWEMFLFECVVFFPDADHYHLLMPVKPEPWVDYIPLIYTPEHFIELNSKLSSNQLDLDSIARNGRNFALKHYSPLPSAQRMLALLPASPFTPSKPCSDKAITFQEWKTKDTERRKAERQRARAIMS